FRRRAGLDAIVSDGEHIGLPLAALLKAAGSDVGHVTIGHRISAAKKRPFFTLLRVDSNISRIALHSRRQHELAVGRLGIDPRRLALLPYQVDTRYWRRAEDVRDERLVVSAGLERRDYATLFEAVRGLDAAVVVGAASHWSRERAGRDAAPPPNVTVGRFDYPSLRSLYARAAIVAVPLRDVDFQAGVTTILEAMAMGKPVVVTHTAGQFDIVVDRRRVTRGPLSRPRPVGLVELLARRDGVAIEPSGYYVAPGDPTGLRAALDHLLEHPEERRRLGAAGREIAERFFDVERFGERMRRIVEDVVRERAGAESAAHGSAKPA
ncbi:MAG TPA: glycosyltransferase family 4 protein, partial [Candidatus Limnocylindria bacterium]|nr:glycosyltransferase family 4 protein [Candidatus Limnocylindria bacterium]